MKKKVLYLLLIGVLLVCLTGCGVNKTEEVKLTGKWESNEHEKLTLYENGTCYWHYKARPHDYYATFETYECSYTTADDEILITTDMDQDNQLKEYEVETCIFKDNVIDCSHEGNGDHGIYKK